jgi:hypothetical protein
VADRIITFAELVGRENVIAGTTAAWAAASVSKSPGPSCVPCATARRSRATSLELNSKVPVRYEQTKKKKVQK